MTKGDAGIRSGACTLTRPVLSEIHLRLATMASKMIYWKCVDCASMINDESMIYDDISEWRHVVEFCYGCMSYNPEVVIAYR